MYKIMIVDDDATSLAIGKALLERDYEVVLMRSGIQALGYLKQDTPPDLILLDVIMPGTGGMDVLRALKKDPALCEIPTFFLTSTTDTNMEIEGFTMGITDFIRKPITPQLLTLKLKRQFDLIELKRENKRMKELLKSWKLQLEGMNL